MLSQIEDLPLLGVRGRYSQPRCLSIDGFSGACVHLEARSAQAKRVAEEMHPRR